MPHRQRLDWLQSGQIGLAKAITGEQRLEQLGENVLQYLATYLDAHAGAFFTKNGGPGFRCVATYGVPAADGIEAASSWVTAFLGAERPRTAGPSSSATCPTDT